MSMEPNGPNTPGDDMPPDPSAPAGASPEAAFPAAREPRLSRRAAWLAMGAVVLALALVWLTPAVHDQQEAATNAAFEGLDAPLHFTLQDVNGVDVKLESFKGKVILVNFWATWCGPCKVEIPDLVELQDEYGEDLVVLGVEIDGSADDVKPFAAEFKMNYPVLLAANRQDVQDAFGPLYGIPVTVFIDREGKIAKRHALMMTKAQFEQEIKALL